MQMRRSTPSFFPSKSKARGGICKAASGLGPAARPAIWAIALAGALPGAGWPLPEDADQPIHIRAQAAEFGRPSDQARYQGSVQVQQGTLRVRADRLIVDRAAGQVLRIRAFGGPAHYRQQLQEGEVRADAASIIYHVQARRIDLQGNARLMQRGSEVAGERIRYDLAAGRVEAEADQGPVRASLQSAAPEG